MKNFIYFIKRKITLGSILNGFASLVFVFLLRYVLQDIYSIYILTEGDLWFKELYLAALVLFRIIFNLLLEFFLGDKLYIPILDGKGILSLSMDQSGSQGSGTHGSNPSSSGVNTSNGKNSGNITKEVFDKIKGDLDKNIQHNIDTQWKMVDKLTEIKKKYDVKFFSKDGNLEISVPSSMSDEQAKKISDQVGVIDRIIQTKFSEYKHLKKVDADFNGKKLDIGTDIMSKANKEFYKLIFDENNDDK